MARGQSQQTACPIYWTNLPIGLEYRVPYYYQKICYRLFEVLSIKILTNFFYKERSLKRK